MAKKALLIGIDDYKDSGIDDLYGCNNDVRKLTSVLMKKYDFPGSCIIQNMDDVATKEYILYGLKWLTKDPKPGDSLVLFFSGHGTQDNELDAEGNNQPQEVLCLWDYQSLDEKTYIKDQELLSYLSTIPDNVSVDVILDCCFSGGMDRATLGRKTKIRGLEKKSGDKIQAIIRKFFGKRAGDTRDPDATSLKFNFWAACGQEDSAKEKMFSDKMRGVFSYYFCKKLEESPMIIRNDLFTQLKTDMGSFTQIPKFEPKHNANTGNLSVFS